MSSNPYASGSPAIPPDATEAGTQNPSLLLSTWRATKRGVRIAAFVGGAFSLLLIIPALALTAFGLGSGHGWAIPRFFFYGIGFFVFFGVFGGIVAAPLGLIAALIRKAHQGPDNASAGDVAERPAHSLPRVGINVASLDNTRPWYRRLLWLWLISVPILIFLAAAFVTGADLGRMVARRNTAATVVADRDDPYWRLDDLMAHLEQVPDEENSALVMDQVLTLLPEGWLGTTKLFPGEQGTRLGQVKQDFGRLNATSKNVRLSDTVADSLRVELKTDEEAVRLARTLEGLRRGRHELEIGPTVLDTLLPETQNSRIVVRLLAVDAAMRAHDGNADGALDSSRAILGAGRSIGDEPFLISLLVRIAIGSVALESTRRVIGQGEPSDAALARLQASVLDELAQPLLLIGMRGERASMTELIRRVGSGEIPISALSGAPKLDQIVSRPADAPWIELWFDYQMTLILEWMNEAVAIAQRPAAEQPARWKAWQANVDRVKQSQFGIYTATLPLLMSPAVAAAGIAFSRYQSDLGATAILIAAERHRRKTGNWPASITAIDRSILPITPDDPYSGQSFRMEHRDGQLLVYSIGPNGMDEHGDYDPKRWPKGGHDDVGAVAWDVPLRRQPPPTVK